MNYIKIKVRLIEEKGDIYRTFWVNEEISLEELGATIVNTFHGLFAHEFIFIADNINFVPRKFYEIGDSLGRIDNEYCYDKYSLNDLLKRTTKIILEYDKRNQYVFEITQLQGQKVYDFDDIDELDNIYYIDGNGYGIFDNYRDILEFVLNQVDPSEYIKEMYECDPDEFIFDFPLNYDDYFLELDEEEMEILKSSALLNFYTAFGGSAHKEPFDTSEGSC